MPMTRAERRQLLRELLDDVESLKARDDQRAVAEGLLTGEEAERLHRQRKREAAAFLYRHRNPPDWP